MKSRIIKPIVLLSALTALSSARAQATEESAAPVAEQIAPEPKVAPPSKEEKKEKVEKPKPPGNEHEKPTAPKDSKESVEDIKTNFRAKADDYVKKQKELVEQMKSAKAEDKAKIREKLKDLKDKWKDDQPTVREMVSDLKEKVDKENKGGKGGKGGGRPRD